MLLKYNLNLKANASYLRNNLTNAEKKLWFYIRKKQILSIQFNRQRRIGPYIVDFYAASINLVIEIDGGQHFTKDHKIKDEIRDCYLHSLNLTVLRFNNNQIFEQLQSILDEIYKTCEEKKKSLLDGNI